MPAIPLDQVDPSQISLTPAAPQAVPLDRVDPTQIVVPGKKQVEVPLDQINPAELQSPRSLVEEHAEKSGYSELLSMAPQFTGDNDGMQALRESLASKLKKEDTKTAADFLWDGVKLNYKIPLAMGKGLWGILTEALPAGVEFAWNVAPGNALVNPGKAMRSIGEGISAVELSAVNAHELVRKAAENIKDEAPRALINHFVPGAGNFVPREARPDKFYLDRADADILGKLTEAETAAGRFAPKIFSEAPAQFGFPIRPDTVSALQPLLDPQNLVPMAVGSALAKKSLTQATFQGLERAATGAEVFSATDAARRTVGSGISSVGRGLQAYGNSPSAVGITAGAAALASGAEPGTAMLAALLGASRTRPVAAVENALKNSGGRLVRVGDAIAGNFGSGPLARFAEASLNFVKPTADAAAHGALAGLPFAFSARDADDVADIVGNGAAFGALGNVAGRTHNFFQVDNLFRDRSTTPDSAIKRPEFSYYGDDHGHPIEAASRAQFDQLSNRAAALFEGLKQFFGKPGADGKPVEFYILNGEMTEKFGASLGEEGAGSRAGFSKDVPGATPEEPGKRIVVINRDVNRGISLGHETGHAFLLSLPEEQQKMLRDTWNRLTTSEEKNTRKQEYERLFNRDAEGNALPEDRHRKLTPEELTDEALAENFSAYLAGVPIEKLGVKRGIADATRMALGSMFEYLGIRKLAGDESKLKTPLGFKPSVALADLFQNFLEARRLENLSLPGDEPPVIDAPKKLPPIEPWQKTLAGTPSGKPAGTTYPKSPVTDKTPAGVARPEDIVAPKQVENTTRPEAPAPASGTPNLRGPNTADLAKPADPETVAKNEQILAADAGKPRHEKTPVETDYYSAKSPVQNPDQVVREQQRLAADAAEQDGQPNPLRQRFQKIFTPYGEIRTSKEGKKTIFGMSVDKIAGNVDLLRGWFNLNPDAANDPNIAGVRTYLSSPDLAGDLQAALQNQSNGFAADGRRLVRPADAVGITPENPRYTPVEIPSDRAQVLNLLFGHEQPQKETAGQAFARRFAEANGVTIHEFNGVSETNSLRAALRDHGFDPRILNAVVENLRIDRMTTELKPRPDLNFPAGDTGIQRAGFMPATEAGNSGQADVGSERGRLGQALGLGRTGADSTGREVRASEDAGTAQLAGKRLEHAIDAPEIKLVHYSGQPNLEVVDQSRFGKGHATATDRRGSDKSYFYVEGSPLGQDEGLVDSGGKTKYTATVSGDRIYDANADPRGWRREINRWQADEDLKAAGYAGLAISAADGRKVVALFEPVRVQKEQAPGQAMYMPATETSPDKLGFYSQLERTLAAVPPKASRQQIEAALRDGVKEKGQLKERPVKNEELADVKDVAGLSFSEYLKQNPNATRDEMLDFVRQNRVQVDENVTGAPKSITLDEAKALGRGKAFGIDQQTGNAVGIFLDSGEVLPYVTRNTNRYTFHEGDVDAYLNRNFGTRYEQYVLPGGKNYQEAVLTLPESKPGPNDYRVVERNGKFIIARPDGTFVDDNWFASKADAQRELVNYGNTPKGYESNHFRGTQNYLAHTRFNERTAADGSKVLFAEELQSDLHQEGRKKGYKTLTPEKEEALYARQDELNKDRTILEASIESLENSLGRDTSDSPLNQRMRRGLAENRARLAELEAEAADIRKQFARIGVQDAPFKKSWPELVFKYLLKKAVDSGAEYLGWTTGEQQAARYDLSKEISRIEVQKVPGMEKVYLAAYDHNPSERRSAGRRVIDQMVLPEEIENYVGKEVAQKLDSMPWKPYNHENSNGTTITQDHKVLSGLDLKVGGEGMKGFYDQILPALADKYLKRFGSKTETIDLVTKNGAESMISERPHGDPDFRWVVYDSRGDRIAHAPTRELAVKALQEAKPDHVSTAHAVKITPELRKAVQEHGQAMYMPATKGFAAEKSLRDEFFKHFERVKATDQDGATFNPNGSVADTGKLPVIVTLGALTQNVADASAQKAANFFNKHGEFLQTPNARPGLFHFGDKLSADLNVALPAEKLDLAKKFAADNNQDSIFNAASMEVVKTGGSGEPRLKTPLEYAVAAKQLADGTYKSIEDVQKIAAGLEGTAVETIPNIDLTAKKKEALADAVVENDGKPLSKIRIGKIEREIEADAAGKMVEVPVIELTPPKGKKTVLDPQTPEKWDEVNRARDAALRVTALDPELGMGEFGYRRAFAEAGLSTQVPPAPEQFARYLKDPQIFADMVKKAQKEHPDLVDSAMSGLAHVAKMHALAREGKLTPEVVALHMAWGIASRMLAPFDQEGGWIRVVRDPAIFDHIDESVNGTYSRSKDEWKAAVQKAMKDSNAFTEDVAASKVGKNAIANLNAFHLMLTKWNGRWEELTSILNDAKLSGPQMRDEFFRRGFGGAGIKHKVDSFVILTLARDDVFIGDRWQVVHANLPLLERIAKEKGYDSPFDYDKNGTPQDRVGIYGAYGPLLDTPAVAQVYYALMERAMTAIGKSKPVVELFGKELPASAVHWLSWNIIKNEPVGHSSLEITHDLLASGKTLRTVGKAALANELATRPLRTQRYNPETKGFDEFTVENNKAVLRRAAGQ